MKNQYSIGIHTKQFPYAVCAIRHVFFVFYLLDICAIAVIQLGTCNTPKRWRRKKNEEKKLCFDMHITIGCAHRTHTHTNILYSNFWHFGYAQDSMYIYLLYWLWPSTNPSHVWHIFANHFHVLNTHFVVKLCTLHLCNELHKFFTDLINVFQQFYQICVYTLVGLGSVDAMFFIVLIDIFLHFDVYRKLSVSVCVNELIMEWMAFELWPLHWWIVCMYDGTKWSKESRR